MWEWLFGKKQKAPIQTPNQNATPSPSSAKKLFNAFDDATNDDKTNDDASNVDPNFKILDTVQKNLAALMIRLDSEYKKWEILQINLNKAQKSFHADIHGLQKPFSFLEFLKHIFIQLKELIESPKLYLQELINHVEPKLDKLRQEMNDLYENTKLTEEQKQLQLAHLALDLIGGLQKINSKVQGEIEYCLDFKKMGESIEEKAIDLAALSATGIPLDFNDPNALSRYKNELFNSIAKQLEHIDKIINDARGDLDKAKKYLQDHPLLMHSSNKTITMWSPDKNVRSVLDKLEEKPTLHRTQSMNAFKS